MITTIIIITIIIIIIIIIIILIIIIAILKRSPCTTKSTPASVSMAAWRVAVAFSVIAVVILYDYYM